MLFYVDDLPIISDDKKIKWVQGLSKGFEMSYLVMLICISKLRYIKLMMGFIFFNENVSRSCLKRFQDTRICISN
jgi:hypothetical protein